MSKLSRKSRRSLETWEQLQARLFHLGYLGEELPAFVAGPPAAWLYWEIVDEALIVARVGIEYGYQAELAKITNPPRSDVDVPPGTESGRDVT